VKSLSLIALSTILAAAPVVADDVYLKNGRVFEDVVAEVGAETVRIQLAFGEMGVPLAAVDRVEHGASSLAAFRERRDALRADPAAEAADWVDLARWAARRDQSHGAREAALVAAELDPRVEGLDELMRRIDYVFEPQVGRWVSFEESMSLRGYTHVDGQWLSPEQLLARSQAAADAARAREAAQESRLTRAVLAMAAAQLAREPEPVYEQPNGWTDYGWPVAVYPGPVVRPHPTPYRRHSIRHDPTAIPLHRRQPGSLFPVAPNPAVQPAATHHGGIAKGSN